MKKKINGRWHITEKKMGRRSFVFVMCVVRAQIVDGWVGGEGFDFYADDDGHPMRGHVQLFVDDDDEDFVEGEFEFEGGASSTFQAKRAG